MLLIKTGPRCISFRCKITVSLAQGAVHDAEADVADPVFVRSTITRTLCTGSSDERAGAISLHTSAGPGGLPPRVRGHPHHTRPRCRSHRRRPDATAPSLGTGCPSYPPPPSSHSPFPPSISSPLPFFSGSLLPPPQLFHLIAPLLPSNSICEHVTCGAACLPPLVRDVSHSLHPRALHALSPTRSHATPHHPPPIAPSTCYHMGVTSRRSRSCARR